MCAILSLAADLIQLLLHILAAKKWQVVYSDTYSCYQIINNTDLIRPGNYMLIIHVSMCVW